MCRRAILAPLAALLAAAGCGGKASSTSTTGTARASRATIEGQRVARLPVTSTSYFATLASTKENPAGLPKSSGAALIGINAASNELCWTFSRLKNVHMPREAALVAHLSFGYTSTPLGSGFQTSGCQVASRLLLRLIEVHSHSFYVNIQNPKHPARAVRGRL